jgi:hypothetical protein
MQSKTSAESTQIFESVSVHPGPIWGLGRLVAAIVGFPAGFFAAEYWGLGVRGEGAAAFAGSICLLACVAGMAKLSASTLTVSNTGVELRNKIRGLTRRIDLDSVDDIVWENGQIRIRYSSGTLVFDGTADPDNLDKAFRLLRRSIEQRRSVD